jgi:hypothetical protein
MRMPGPSLRFAGTLLLITLVTPDYSAAADQPDLSGIWDAGVRFRMDPPKTTELGARMMREHDPRNDDSIECVRFGAAQQAAAPYPRAVSQSADLLTIHYELWQEARTIYLDGRSPPGDWEPSRLGYSTGEFVGGELVVETIGLEPSLLWAENGLHHSDQLRLIEHYRLDESGDYIHLEITFEDPVMLEEPWVVTMAPWARDTDATLYPYVCESISGEPDFGE